MILLYDSVGPLSLYGPDVPAAHQGKIPDFSSKSGPFLKPKIEKMGTLKKKWGPNGNPKSERGPHGDPGPQMGTCVGAVCIFGHCPNCDLTPPIAQI